MADEILAQLVRYNEAHAGPRNAERLVLAVRAPDGTLLGGLAAMYGWTGLFIDYLWVDERLRGRGVGTELVRSAEQWLSERGGGTVFLSTYSFQAPRFYEKLGYSAFGTLVDVPPGASRTWYAKRAR